MEDDDDDVRFRPGYVPPRPEELLSDGCGDSDEETSDEETATSATTESDSTAEEEEEEDSDHDEDPPTPPAEYMNPVMGRPAKRERDG